MIAIIAGALAGAIIALLLASAIRLFVILGGK